LGSSIVEIVIAHGTPASAVYVDLQNAAGGSTSNPSVDGCCSTVESDSCCAVSAAALCQARRYSRKIEALWSAVAWITAKIAVFVAAGARTTAAAGDVGSRNARVKCARTAT
jgi:hypothetical protein